MSANRPDPNPTPIASAFSLLNGAGPPDPRIWDEMAAIREKASDPSAPVDERIEAFEDIIDCEVGDTVLSRARNIERLYGLRQIYLKFDGGNPTGTQKDRIAFAQVLDALRRGFDGITVATCGNYGAAVSLAASLAGIRCHLYVPAGYHTRRIDEMERGGAKIIRIEGDYEKAVDESRNWAEQEEMYDANPGGDNTAIQFRAYGEIAYEIYDELRDAPAAVAVPVSNGTTLAGIYRGFTSLNRRGKTCRVPRMVAGSTFHKNPIVRAVIKQLESCEDLEPASVRETRVNEPLVNWHSIDGDHAVEAVRRSGGWANHASDRTMVALSKLLREQEGLNVLPASTASLSSLLEVHRRTPLPPDRYVVVLTGRRA